MHTLSAQQLEALEALSSGHSVTAAAAAVGIHRTTIHTWCRRLTQFRTALEAATQSRAAAIRDEIHELAVPSLALLKHTIEDVSAPAALRIRAALAILKFATAPEPLPSVKAATVETLLDAAYTTGRAEVEAESGSPTPIHQFSSLSSSAPAVEQTPRSALCPCGSKLKFKRCCGRGAPPVLTRAA